MSAKQTSLLIVILLLIFVGNMSTFVVNQREQALVLQFGNPKRVVQQSGLHFRLPWQSVTYFDKRLLLQDAPPNEIITKDKKTLLVDAYTRWSIADPLKVYQVANNEQGVAARMADVVRSKMRDVLGQHTLAEIVTGVSESSKDDNDDLRTKMMHSIQIQTDHEVQDLGIHVRDVRIKLTDLPKENSAAVFHRMKAERQRIAKEYRSQGEEAAKEIRAEADKTRKVVLAQAYRQSEIIRGRADAETTRVYAKAHRQDPDFYAFLRSLKAYRKSVKEGSTLVLSPDSEFFRFFEHSGSK
ncbi:MAG TPA: protease modulator HflC [Mariprofundaceae bacterium]|nr:protease modulator HflC [Mariprofundaceae bacterium]